MKKLLELNGQKLKSYFVKLMENDKIILYFESIPKDEQIL
jgi:hypothetical protein